jgi:hypothetical protein
VDVSLPCAEINRVRSREQGSTVDALALEPTKDAITCEKPRRAGDKR